jgi:hypothetical protein
VQSNSRSGLLVCAILSLLVVLGLTSFADAQSFRSSAETWGQSYRPAGLVNLEARSHVYPWIRGETQIWAGQAPRSDNPTGQVVILSAMVQEPTGHFALRAGRFVLATGAVRPVHLDGAHAQVRTQFGSQLEVFGGVPVSLALSARAYDWLLGGRFAQRLGAFGVLGMSYVEQRDHGRETNQELGADLALYILRQLSVSGRAAYDLAARGVAETTLTGSYGSSERRIEVFGSLRNASLIMPSTSLFSVLSNEASLQTGVSGRVRVAPRLRLEGLVAYRAQGDRAGVRARVGGTLWLSDDQGSALEGFVTRDGVGDGQWTGVRVLLMREVITDLRLMGEIELVAPDHARDSGAVWPWGRLSARYTLLEHWQLSMGAEGSSSPRFTKLFQGLVRVAYEFAQGVP